MVNCMCTFSNLLISTLAVPTIVPSRLIGDFVGVVPGAEGLTGGEGAVMTTLVGGETATCFGGETTTVLGTVTSLIGAAIWGWSGFAGDICWAFATGVEMAILTGPWPCAGGFAIIGVIWVAADGYILINSATVLAGTCGTPGGLGGELKPVEPGTWGGASRSGDKDGGVMLKLPPVGAGMGGREGTKFKGLRSR